MFSGCTSLTSIDLSNFNTSSVVDMGNMFSGCSFLRSLDLSNFDTSSVTSMDYMFFECSSLISLYIDNFDVSSVSNFDYIFYNCSSLVSLNLTNFYYVVDNYSEMFTNCNPNLEYCIDEKLTYSFTDLLNNYECNCTDICIYWNSKKYFLEENICIDECPNYIDGEYFYEIYNICYKQGYVTINETIDVLPPVGSNSPGEKISKGLLIGIIIVGVFLIIVVSIVIIFKLKNNNIKITFIEEDKTEKTIEISKKKKVGDLVNEYYKRYYKVKKIENKISFEYNGNFIDLENSENIQIEKFFKTNKENYTPSLSNKNLNTINPNTKNVINETSFNVPIDNITNVNDSKIEINVKQNIRIIYKEFNIRNPTEIYITTEKKMFDLIDIYYKKKVMKNENKYKFICGGKNIDSEKNKNKPIENKFLEIWVVEVEKIKIKFHDNSKTPIEIDIYINQKASDLIDIYYKKRGIPNDNKKNFICKEDIIASKDNKNEKIEYFYKKDNLNNNKILDVFVLDKGMIKVKYSEEGTQLFELYISSEKTIKDLVDIYYKKTRTKTNNKKSFLSNGCNISLKENINKKIRNFIKEDLLIFSIIIENINE